LKTDSHTKQIYVPIGKQTDYKNLCFDPLENTQD